ncbi:MAG: tetratricopeptide repeat protein [Bacteroidales bacterium]|nr:tetratricopeptide repeat protein [Bacteroidales bacterium]MCB9012583.1 tetratricopeptide repeat protein [Bacteroidales bacterium]
MKKLRIFILLAFTLVLQDSFATKVSLDSLDYYISHQYEYDMQKEDFIQKIKDEITRNKEDNQKLYQLYVDMFEEYRSYIYDSAYVYVAKLIDISSALNDSDKIISSKVKLGFCYLSSGLFKEAFDILSSLDVENCAIETKIEYYTCKSRLYFDLGDYNNTAEFKNQYNKTGNQIIDSALSLIKYNSAQYWATLGLKYMKSDNYDGALDAFHKMIGSQNYSEHDFAIATSSIAYILTLKGEKEEAEKYLIEAAIADIKSSVKETVAARNLAQLLYEDKEIGPAVKYIRKALDDASFYNARHRQIEIGHILPIIERERINIIENQRDRILSVSILISFLLLALVVAFIIIWKSLKRLNIAQRIIQDSNNQLTEANKIKDEYIAYFFNQNSDYISKIEKLEKWVSRKVAAKQYQGLRSLTQILNVDKEREALFERFDRIFLKLFPDFVEEFNKLLKPEEQIQPKEGELLNPDLRIYALIRLGINDNEKIASFLNYSVNTIYAYKTKIKAKASCPSDQFKKKVLEIKSI